MALQPVFQGNTFLFHWPPGMTIRLGFRKIWWAGIGTYVPTRIASLNRIVHLNNLNRFVHAWTVLSAKVISYPTVKIRVQQKVILLENFDQKTIRFNPYCPYWKFWAKNNTVQPILLFKKILRKRQYCLIHIAFYENFIDKIMRFNPYSFVANSWSKDKTV